MSPLRLAKHYSLDKRTVRKDREQELFQPEECASVSSFSIDSYVPISPEHRVEELKEEDEVDSSNFTGFDSLLLSMDGENTPRFDDAFGASGLGTVVKDLRDTDNYSIFLRNLSDWRASYSEELVRALEIKD